MAARKPLVVGADGLTQQLQTGDSLDGAAASSGIQVYVAANVYAAGDQVSVGGGLIVKANDAIAANTAFAWGISGATWRPVDTAGMTWQGAWAPGPYGASDCVGFGLYKLYVSPTGVAGGDAPSAAGSGWAPLDLFRHPAMVGASSTIPGGQGMAPKPLAGEHGKFLRGDGSWAEWSDAVASASGVYTVPSWGMLIEVSGAVASTITLPRANAVDVGKSVNIFNAGTGTATVIPNATIPDLLVGAATIHPGAGLTYEVTQGGVVRPVSSLTAPAVDSIQALTATGAITAWGSLVLANSVPSITGTLPAATAQHVGKRTTVKNNGTGAVTVGANGTDVLVGAATLSPGQAVTFEVTAVGVVHAVADLTGSTTLASFQSSDAAITNGQSTNSTSFVDITGASITVPGAGTYEIEYSIPTNSNTVGQAQVTAFTDSVNNVIPGTYSAMGEANGGGFTGPNTGRAEVTVTGPTTYKVRWRVSGGTGTIGNDTTNSGSAWVRYRQLPTATTVNLGTITPTTLHSLNIVTATAAITSGFAGTTWTAGVGTGGRVKLGSLVRNLNTGGFTIVGDTLVATAAGKYSMTANVFGTPTSPGGTQAGIVLYKNGTLFAGADNFPPANNTYQTDCTAEVSVIAGDVLDVRYFNANAGSPQMAMSLSLVPIAAGSIIAPGSIPAMTGATAGAPGTVGWIGTAPAAGQQGRFWRGDATWAEVGVKAFVDGAAYSAGEIVSLINGTFIKANGAIPATTLFAWGTTGATWTPIDVAITGMNWRGEWTATPTPAYSGSDVVGLGFSLYYEALGISSGLSPDLPGSGFYPLASLYSARFAPATATLDGSDGMVPGPLASDTGKFLKADGTWSDPFNDQSASGYFDMGTMRMQFGTVTMGANPQTITLPAAFANTNYRITFGGAHATGGGVNFGWQSKGTTSFQITGIVPGTGASNPQTADWIAIGRKP